MSNSAARTNPPAGSSRLSLLSAENAKYVCVCGTGWGGGDRFIEVNHFLTGITSTCAVSCDFLTKVWNRNEETGFFSARTGEARASPRFAVNTELSTPPHAPLPEAGERVLGGFLSSRSSARTRPGRELWALGWRRQPRGSSGATRCRLRRF